MVCMLSEFLESLPITTFTGEAFKQSQQGGCSPFSRNCQRGSIPDKPDFIFVAEKMKRLSKLGQMTRWVVCTIEAALVFVEFIEGIVNSSHHFGLGGKSLCCSSVVDIERNPPHSLIFFWFDIPRGQEPALTNGELIRFFGNREDWETNFTDPWVLYSLSKGDT